MHDALHMSRKSHTHKRAFLLNSRGDPSNHMLSHENKCGVRERGSGRGDEQNRAGGHPLKVAITVAACIAHAVCVIHATFERGSERLEPSVRMLRKTWHAVAVVHAIWLTCAQSIRAWSRHQCKGVAASRSDTHLAPVKVSTVAAPRGLHLGVASRVLIVVIHAEQERVLRLEGEAKAVHRADSGA